MKTYAPSYYNSYHCIANKCKKNCCTGWEIDIDEASLKKYKSLTGPLWEKVSSVIDESGEMPHFRLTENGRCPLLTDDNLCTIMLETGSDRDLCQICYDHPRFRNFWTDRIEIGLGIACEEAARLVLSQKEPLSLIVIEDDGMQTPIPDDEAFLLDVRAQLFQSLSEKTFPTPMHQRLAEYFVYRHIADALYDDRLEERIQMVEDFYRDCTGRLPCPNPTLDEFVSVCVDFSIEKEYVV